jgi:hypothetical protein
MILITMVGSKQRTPVLHNHLLNMARTQYGELPLSTLCDLPYGAKWPRIQSTPNNIYTMPIRPPSMVWKPTFTKGKIGILDLGGLRNKVPHPRKTHWKIKFIELVLIITMI